MLLMTETPSGSPPFGQVAERTRREGVAFDSWLDRQFCDLCDSISAHPPIDELIALIDRDAMATFAKE